MIKKTKHVNIIIALTQESQDKHQALLKAVPEIKAVLTEAKAENQSFINKYDDRFVLAPEGNMGSVIRRHYKKGNDIELIPAILEVIRQFQRS